MIPTPFAIFVLLAALGSRGGQMPRTLMLCCLFGATAAIELPALGGAPITPAVLLLPFLVWRALREEGTTAMLRPLAFPQAGFWLLAVVVWGVLSAYFMPRFFAGQTLLYGTDRSVMTGIKLLPLQPLSTNLTQSAYAIGALAAFAALVALLQPAGRLARFGDAVLLLGAVDAGAAFINLAELHLGLPSVLALVRNAGYAILVGGDIGGLQRISGTFAETSAFAAFTLPVLAFASVLWRERVRPRYSGAVTLLLLGLLLLSTSSTAYAGLGAYAICALLGAAGQMLARAAGPRLGWGTVLVWAAAVAGCLLLLLSPSFTDRVVDFFGVTLVRKLESSSGIERSSWNLQAWTNFIDVYGVGVGLGSARASSFVLVLLSNLGLLGTLLFAAFMAQLLRPAVPTDAMPTAASPADAAIEAAVMRAARHAVLAGLIAATISGVVFDLGLAFYAFAAAAVARRQAVPVQAPTAPGELHAAV